METSGKCSPEESQSVGSYGQKKDARHLKEIEELRAIARNEHESLEAMIRTLEQQLQQQKDRTDRFIADWQI